MFYLLPEEVRDAIIAYLESRPLGEVINGWTILHQLKKVEVGEAAVTNEQKDN